MENSSKTKPQIVICLGSSCFARGNAANVEVLEKYLQEHDLHDGVDVEMSGGLCEGNCAAGPNVLFNGKLYEHVDAGVMLDLLEKNLGGIQAKSSGPGKEIKE